MSHVEKSIGVTFFLGVDAGPGGERPCHISELRVDDGVERLTFRLADMWAAGGKELVLQTSLSVGAIFQSPMTPINRYGEISRYGEINRYAEFVVGRRGWDAGADDFSVVGAGPSG
jgi:hypothetical protein